MLKCVVLAGVRVATRALLLCSLFITFSASPTFAGTVTLVWDPSPDTNVVGYNIYVGGAPATYTNKVSAGNQLSLALGNLKVGATYYFAATAYTAEQIESDFSTEVSAYIAPAQSNSPPIALPLNISTIEDQSRSITLSGTDPDQDPVSFQIISAPTYGILSGTAPNLSYRPGTNYFGADSFTYRVSDGSLNSLPATVTIDVAAINDPPTLNPVANLVLNENAGAQTIPLAGITSGAANEADSLIVTAVSSDRTLIPDPTVSYSSPASTGTLTLVPVENRAGSAIITVTVDDGQSLNRSFSRSFAVAVTAARPESNSPPYISLISDQVTSRGVPSAPIEFSIGDLETAPEALELTAEASATNLLVGTNIVFGGSGSNRTVVLYPAPEQTGETLVSIILSDGLLTATQTFALYVLPPSVKVALATEGDGAVSRTVSGQTYTLTAKAAAGQVFTGWSGGVTSSSPTLTLTLRTNTIVRANFKPITVQVTGSGTMTPNLATARGLVAGRTYSVTAVPATGFEFSHWSGAVQSQNPALKFVMLPNMSVVANFVPSPFIPVSGLYNGLFYEPAEVRHHSSGSFRLTLSKRGYYSGRVLIGIKSYAIAGRFSLAGEARSIVPRGTNSPLTVLLQLGADQQADQISGTISDGTWTANLASDRLVFAATTNAAPFAGRYTFIVPGSPASMGTGYGTLLFGRSGNALFTGRLGDNTAFSRYATASKAGLMPLYVPLYNGKGSLLSWVALADRPTDDFYGLASWIRPGLAAARYYPEGFTNITEVKGSFFVAPTATEPVLTLGSAEINFQGYEIAPGFANAIALTNSSRVVNLGENKMAMSLNRTNGVFSGSVLVPGSSSTKTFGGVVLQKQNLGYGLLVGTNHTGTVVVSE